MLSRVLPPGNRVLPAGGFPIGAWPKADFDHFKALVAVHAANEGHAFVGRARIGGSGLEGPYQPLGGDEDLGMVGVFNRSDEHTGGGVAGFEVQPEDDGRRKRWRLLGCRRPVSWGGYMRRCRVGGRRWGRRCGIFTLQFAALGGGSGG